MYFYFSTELFSSIHLPWKHVNNFHFMKSSTYWDSGICHTATSEVGTPRLTYMVLSLLRKRKPCCIQLQAKNLAGFNSSPRGKASLLYYMCGMMCCNA